MVMTIDDARTHAIDGMAKPGEWLTGAERVAAWTAARNPSAIPDGLSTAELDVVQRIAMDPGGLTREWADGAMNSIRTAEPDRDAEEAEGRYVELAAIAAISRVIDVMDRSLGREPTPIPGGMDGDIGGDRAGAPSRQRPGDVGDVGAWVAQSTGPTRANVSRTFSLLPETNVLWRDLVDSHYSRGVEFMQLDWDRALSRPQVELVASRTTALNECFY